MDDVIDAIIARLATLVATSPFSDIMVVNTIWYGDPLLVVVRQYPYLYVQADSEEPLSETTAYEVVTNNINIGLVVMPSEYFDAAVDDSPGDRPLVQAAQLIRRDMRREVTRKFLIPTVRDVRVSGITYTPDLRNEVFIKQAIVNMSVDIQYAKED